MLLYWPGVISHFADHQEEYIFQYRFQRLSFFLRLLVFAQNHLIGNKYMYIVE
jgi:hypothetical protein